MDTEYIFLADILSKFHTSSELVQVALLAAISATAIGIVWIIKEMLALFAKRKQLPVGKLIYSVHLMGDNKLMVYKHLNIRRC